LPVHQVFSEQIIVFPLPRAADFGVLQSRIHDAWARMQGSTLEDRLRYTPSDCFETFPFPLKPELAPGTALDAVAQALHERRTAFMVERDLGLTKTYNALKNPEDHDPDVLALRDLHEALDRAVLQA